MKRFTLAILISFASLAIVFHFVEIAGLGLSVPEFEYVEQDSSFAPLLEYGIIPVDSFHVTTGTIRRNQTLGRIWDSHGVSPEHIRQLPAKARDVFNIRSIRAGNPYRIYATPDSLSEVNFFVYEHNQTDYVVFQFTDTLKVLPQTKEIDAIQRLSEAEISSSLWETMRAHGLNPVLALDLSEVFAWAVDFFGLHQGDSFKVLYDELYVDGKPIGIGTIHAAWFEHRGEKHYAFRFQQDSVWSYWDEEGNSLRRSFLKAPLRYSRISSRFTNSRFHPVLRVYRPHTGVDYAAPTGTPVVALGDGVVIERGYDRAAGNYVKIRHNSVYTTGYNHFSRFGAGIRVGTRVTQGQVIGYVGQTGYSTGPHLDLRFWKNGRPIDPLKVEAPPVEPIDEVNRDEFLSIKAEFREVLDNISHRPVFPSVTEQLLFY